MNTKDTKVAHPNKDMIEAWASGEKLQFRHPNWDSWRDWDCDFDRLPDLLVVAAGGHEWRVKPKVTPCEARGYKVGDRFLVAVGWDDGVFPLSLKENEPVFSMIVELYDDDGSVVPQVRILVPTQHHRIGKFIFIHIDGVKKIELFGEEK